ncbi:tRNA (N6-threonylcarbamoyladenosine(37)-N6)-methyltransferase TrmO [Psychrobacter immobilis]|uniref:tRNA (N6-threonylcarbamoyladenosine(37)-N6)-methyltransferase TrmO n=1 Tax=Psychrobacter immobilis TaxID=498 RepID=UPI001917EC4B|nr:tRNA (N6-threonylcarbamoyladenosine(37)-N6)-methyltransferase TrmO [Psychrobacter immobilis]
MLDENPLLDNYHQAPVIGYHRAPLSQKFGAPRQPNLVALTSVIEMLAPYDTPAAFDGLDKFSHIWVSWQFHHNYRYKNNNEASSDFRAQVRPPRLGGNQKIGVFASRSMYRPSGLGLSVVKLEQVKIVQGRVLLIIKGADMIDGTPIIDIKPYVAYSDALIQTENGFAPTAPELLNVTVTDAANEQFMMLVSAGEPSDANNNDTSIKDANTGSNSATVASTIHRIQNQLITSDMSIIKELIAQDPRPAYRRIEIATPFVMRYKSVDVSFQLIESGQLQITAVAAI